MTGRWRNAAGLGRIRNRVDCCKQFWHSNLLTQFSLDFVAIFKNFILESIFGICCFLCCIFEAHKVIFSKCLLHAARIGRNFYDCCRSCQHLLCHCAAYNRTSTDLLGNYILNNLADIVATDISAILKFVLRSKWFCHEELERQLDFISLI